MEDRDEEREREPREREYERENGATNGEEPKGKQYITSKQYAAC